MNSGKTDRTADRAAHRAAHRATDPKMNPKAVSKGDPAGHATGDPTTDPRLTSFIPVETGSHFPIQNLPYCVFQRPDDDAPRVGVRIGDMVLDLQMLQKHDLCLGPQLPKGIFAQPSLNLFMGLGPDTWRAARVEISRLLSTDESRLQDDVALQEKVLLSIEQVRVRMPVRIGDYTDFYSSREHAANVGTMFRGKENALLPNWLELPVAYHGRASTVILSGTAFHRPRGQVMPEGSQRPVFSPSHLLDFELEMGFFVGPGNAFGRPIPVDEAAEHIFGMVLVNDWSARDIQKWEYQPLGPFNAKNFATSISPWVVSMDALAPFRCAGPPQDPEPLAYLRTPGQHAYDIQLEVWLRGAKMERGRRICRSNFKHVYWNLEQQLAHHTISGCNVQPGDLMASGTVSAPDPDGYGSMLELTWNGSKPLIFENGEQRKFLADGDTVTMTGWCEGDGYRIGFGEVSGTVLPVRD